MHYSRGGHIYLSIPRNAVPALYLEVFNVGALAFLVREPSQVPFLLRLTQRELARVPYGTGTYFCRC